MKNICIYLILLSAVFSYNTGYSGMYFSDGFTLSGSYSNQEEDGEESNALGLGFSYLTYQKEVNSSDIPTLFQGGSLEVSGFYNSIDSDGLNMEMLSAGLGFYLKNTKFTFYYETLHDFSGDQLDNLNDQGYDMEMTATNQIFSIGFYKTYIQTDKLAYTPFLDLMRLEGDISTTAILNGEEFLNMEQSVSANLIRLGLGFEMNNLVIQPMVTINEDDEKRYTITAIFKL